MWKRLTQFSLFLPLLLAPTAHAKEKPFSAKIMISVENINIKDVDAWAKESCGKIHEIASAHGEITSNCVRLNGLENLLDDPIGKAEKSGEYILHVQLRETTPKTFKLMIENWGAEDDTEPKHLEWRLETREGDWQKDATPILDNLLTYAKHRNQIKQMVLAQGLSESRKLKVNEEGHVIDVASGKALNGKQAYSTFAEENTRQKNFLRAALEIGAMIGLASLNYYHPLKGGPNSNEHDWEYWGVKGQRDKFSNNLQGVRFDDNGFDVNRGHALAGMMYYQVLRNNGFSTMESFLYTFAASSTWEMVTEHREVLSINDQILTPVGGFILGEVFHQMSQLILSRSNALPAKVLATIFDLPGAFNRWQSKNNNSGFHNLRGSGFSENKLSHFDIFADVKSGNGDANSASGMTVGVRGEVVSIPLYDEAGQVSQLYTDSVFTELLMSGSTKKEAFEDFTLLAKLVFAAYHKKNLALDAAGKKNGYTMFVGAGSAVEYNEHNREGTTPDLNATVHVIGSTLDISAYVKGVRIRASVDVYGDFAMVNAYALDMYKGQGNSTNGTVATIDNHGYYYASGITARSNLSVTWERIQVGYSISKQTLDSINSRNRNQSVVTKNFDFADETTKQEIFVSYDINKSWKFRFSIERTDRSGTLDGGYDTSSSETRKMGTLIYTF